MNYTGPITRHLVYHIWPTRRSDTWRRNLDQLLARIDLFNGRRRIGIAVDRGSDPAEAVQEYLRGHNFEYVVVPNKRQMGEVQTFQELLEPLATDSPNEVIFRAHAKGVRRGTYNRSSPVHRWATIMYETLLDYWPLVQASLQRHAFTGSFRRIGRFWDKPHESACYSGSFYWMRSAALFARDWKRIEPTYWGAESYPGCVSESDECGCIFMNGIVANPYRASEMRIAEKHYANWRANNAGVHHVVQSVDAPAEHGRRSPVVRRRFRTAF